MILTLSLIKTEIFISISTAGILILFGDQSKRLSHECDAYRDLIFYHKVHAITLKAFMQSDI